MKKELIGLNTYLFTFDLDKKDLYLLNKEKLSKYGTITEVFINNGYAFEVKLFREI